MSKILMLIWGFIFAVSTFAYGQQKFTVSGEINFHGEKGEFLVWLKTQEEHENREKPTPTERSLSIKPSSQQLKTNKFTFKFIDVPKGSYCIHSHQDLNLNGKWDHSPETFAPVEPYGYSGPTYFGSAQWDDIKFEVDKDISGIEIWLPSI